jgi:hypothetical protein
MGANHGRGNPSGNWRVISETFAFRWQDRQLACRLIERNPANTFDHAAELSEDREEIEAVLDGETINPLAPPAEGWIGSQGDIEVVDRADDRPLIEEVVEHRFPTPAALHTRLGGSETEAPRRRKRGMRAALVVANGVRGLVTSVRNYLGSFSNRLNK